MKVKIGNTIYDAEKEPIMLILDEQTRINICNMLPSNKKYCAYPQSMNKDEIEKFMELNG